MAIHPGTPPINLDPYEVGKREGYEIGKRKAIDNIINKLMNYNEFLLHADANGNLLYFDFAAWLDEVKGELTC